jgi:hypothetical protein
VCEQLLQLWCIGVAPLTILLHGPLWAVSDLGTQHSRHSDVEPVLLQQASDPKPAMARTASAADLEHVQMGCDLAQKDDAAAHFCITTEP